MTAYRVTWEIDIDADNPADAARKAERIIEAREALTKASLTLANESTENGPPRPSVAEAGA